MSPKQRRQGGETWGGVSGILIDMGREKDMLFGSDETQNIVAVHTEGDRAYIYTRTDTQVETTEDDFTPWLLATAQNASVGGNWEELEGDGFKWLALFGDFAELTEARDYLRGQQNEVFAFQSPAQHYLALTGKTLFRGMALEDIVRMQIDIETTSFKSDHRKARILCAAITDNRGFEAVIDGDEKSLIEELIHIVESRDPDVIEGHNIYNFDLPYIAGRAKAHGVLCTLGRGGREIFFGAKMRCAVGYYTIPFTWCYIPGRHIIDTLFAVHRYDLPRGELPSHGLKAAAKFYGITEDDREIVPGDQIAAEWEINPERVKKYNLQDSLETRSLAEIVTPVEFYVAQMVPDNYQRAAVSGNGEKINSLFVRAYLAARHAIPKQDEPKELPGGYTEVLETGVITRVVKCDVESLYPSIMLANSLKPAKDELDIFLAGLQELKNRRFEAKERAQKSTGKERGYWDGVQAAFKIIINSFYGYLAGPFNFNDYEAAREVTSTGRKIVKDIVKELERDGCLVIEVDTDGVYFQPPEGIDSFEKEVEYIKKIGNTLPAGINLAHDGRYASMISLKKKNYILLDYDGEMIFKGSAMRSRADEKFGLFFIRKTAELLLKGKREEVRGLYDGMCDKIVAGELGVEEFSRRERITEKTLTSPQRRRMAAAVGDRKVGEYVHVYERADGTIGLAEDYAGDEDRAYLLEKLYKFGARLKEAFGEDFDSIFTKPAVVKKRLEKQEGLF